VPGLAEIIHLRTPSCRQAADFLPAMAAGDEGEPAAALHVEHCLRCQAEVSAYRRLFRTLRALGDESVAAPPGALAAVLAALEVAAAEHSSGSSRVLRAAYFGGLTFATAAAGAAGVLVWMSRRRLNLADAS
jgi:hypothetical protein